MKKNATAIWGGVLILLGIVFLLETLGVVHFVGRLIWAAVLAGIGLPFLFIYLSDRREWWALFPGCIMLGVGTGVLVGGPLAAMIIVGGISLPFWWIYLTDRQQWWALIPGWVLACVVIIILLGWINLEWLIAPFVMFAIALPFILVYLSDPDQWWALIPGGIMAGIGVLLLTLTVVSSVRFWPALLIAAGVWLLYRAMRPRTVRTNQVPPSVPSSFSEVTTPDPAAQPDEPR